MKKLLIVTQAINLDDPILGFFHHWVEMLASRFESIEVICLKKGRCTLPPNVRVHSLGKEGGRRSRLMYATRFGRLIWKLRPQYDSVFVHMNPEYVILAGLDWRLMGKKIAFWYNHPHADWRLWLAARFADVIFYTSPYSATAKLAKAIRMPAGIDTEIFKPSQTVPRKRLAFYMQGRITPSKHLDIALAALRLVRRDIPDATLTLVGPEDEHYGTQLRKKFADVLSAVVFAGPKQNEETPGLYRAHGVSLNLAAAGHYDKSVLESLACETPVILASPAFGDLVPGEWVVSPNDPTALARAIERVVALPDAAYRALGAAERAAVTKAESLDSLVRTLAEKLSV